MNIEEYKNIFGFIAESFDFDNCFDGWVNTKDDRLMVLTLQKSSYGKYFDLNIKFYIQGLHNENYILDKNLVQNEVGDVFRRQPEEYNVNLRYEDLKLQQAEKLILKLFRGFIIPLAKKTNTIDGIIKCSIEKELYLLPAIKEKLIK